MKQYCVNLYDRYRAENALKNKNIDHKWYKSDHIKVSDSDAECVEAIFYELDVSYDLMQG